MGKRANWSYLPGGLDNQKAIRPLPRQVYLAVDTKQLYICFDEGIWSRYGGILQVVTGQTRTRMMVVSKEVAVK